MVFSSILSGRSHPQYVAFRPCEARPLRPASTDSSRQPRYLPHQAPGNHRTAHFPIPKGRDSRGRTGVSRASTSGFRLSQATRPGAFRLSLDLVFRRLGVSGTIIPNSLVTFRSTE